MHSWPFPNNPREVQLEALQAGYGKPGFAYFMRQRLGKTWTAYAEFQLLRKEGKCKWFMVVCPNSLKEQWKNDIEEVTPMFPVIIYESSNKAKIKKYYKKNQKFGAMIINYESMNALVEDEDFPLFDPGITFLVLDESTKIKEPSTKAAKACHSVAHLCAYVRILSGKPSANSNADMWSQLNAIGATKLTYYSFRHYYVQYGGYLGKQVLNNVNTEHLRASMAPFCYIAPDKYLKGFEKIYEPMRRVRLTRELEKQYKQMEDELIFELANDVKISAPIALTRYLRLQQISSGIAGDIEGNQHNLIDPADNPRIRIVREILDSEVSDKVIIPCRFVLSAINIKRVLERDGYKCALLLGQGPLSKLHTTPEQEKAKFNSDHNVMIAQLQTLSFGHTLCGPDDNPCTNMIFYENDFSLLNRMQSESRPEKFGRDFPISYFDMYASKMDRYMIQALIKKEEGAMALMGYSRELGLRPNTLAKEMKDANEDRKPEDPQADLLI